MKLKCVGGGETPQWCSASTQSALQWSILHCLPVMVPFSAQSSPTELCYKTFLLHCCLTQVSKDSLLFSFQNLISWSVFQYRFHMAQYPGPHQCREHWTKWDARRREHNRERTDSNYRSLIYCYALSSVCIYRPLCILMQRQYVQERKQTVLTVT